MVRRRNRGGVGRVSAISKECRIVNGGGDGGFVNHCEQVLDDQNKMVMAASKIAVVSGSDQTVTSVNHRDYPLAPNKLNHKLKEEYRKSVALLNEKILKLTNEVDNLKQKLAVTEKNLDVLPFTQVSSTCSSGIGNLSLADRQDEQEQQGIKFKKRRISQAATKQPNPDPLESIQIKPFVIRLERMSQETINQYVGKSVAREKNLDALPFTQVSSTCSSGIGNLSLADRQDEQQQRGIKFKKRRISRAATKQPNPDPLESNQIKPFVIRLERMSQETINQYVGKSVAREKNLDALPFTQVSSTCSSGIGNLSLADRQDEQEQQGIKFKKRRISQAAPKQPNPDPLESIQIKPFVIRLERMSQETINQYVGKSVAREKNLDALPFTQVSSTCSSGIGNLSLADRQDEQEQQGIKFKKRRISQAAPKQPNPDPLESIQIKPFVIRLERMSQETINQYLGKSVAREKNLDALPFTQVSSTCSSGIGNLSLADRQDEQEQRGIKFKKRRISQAATKQPNPDPLESNQTKQRRTTKIRKMQELSSITADDAYYTCLGNYDPTKDEPVSKNTKSNLEIPSWRVIEYSGSHSVEGTEIMSDHIFEKRHHKHEKKEQICKKRDLRRLKELIRVKNLKQGRNKHHSQKSNNKEELTTLLPCPLNLKAIEIIDKLPVSAFGCNLYNLKC